MENDIKEDSLVSEPDLELQHGLPEGIELQGHGVLGLNDALIQQQEKMILNIFDASSIDTIDWINLPKSKITESLHVMKPYLQALEKATALSFRDVWYLKNQEYILQGVSAFVKPGMLVCAMGPVDSGFSTLLQVLAGRQVGGKVSGDILLGGKPPGPDYATLTGYVPAHDIHYATQTVYEAVRFSLDLRVPFQIPPQFADIRTKAILKMLNLIHRCDSIVGDATLRGLSGGEKRRLSIAVELAAGHSLFLMDLPTNGLDSLSAMELVQVSRTLVQTGKSMLMSLVQPAPQLYAQFDHVLLMCKGVCAYFGPTDQAVPYFNSLGYAKPPGGLKSDPDFLSEIMSNPMSHYNPSPSLPISSFISPTALQLHPNVLITGGSPQSLSESYYHSSLYENVGTSLWLDPSLRPQVCPSSPDTTRHPPKFVQKHVVGMRLHYSRPFVDQFVLLLKREAILMSRNRPVQRSRLGKALILALLVGTVFLNLGSSSADANARMGVIFTSMTAFAMGASQAIPQFFVSRAIFYQQRNGGYFRAISYFLSSFISELPVTLLEIALFSLPMYALCGFQGTVLISEHYWLFFLIMVQTNLISRAFATMLSVALPTEELAQALSTACMILFMLFAGYLQPAGEIPTPWVWMHYLSFFRLAFRALVTNEMDGLSFDCPDEGVCLYTSGRGVLDYYDMLHNGGEVYDPWTDFGTNFVFFAGYNILVLLCMAVLNYEGSSQAIRIEAKGQGVVKEVEADEEGKDEQPLALLGDNAIELGFSSLDYFVPLKDGTQLQVLHSIDGFAKKGMCVALMGPSGAGKSTLMDVLALRKTVGDITGSVLVDGHAQTSLFSRVSGYVEQFDSLIPTQTVREFIETSAALRLPRSLSDSQREQLVEEVLLSLGLHQIQDMLIGNSETGLSLELRKKTSIAVEVVCRPGLLFMDEPTTGLDSLSALAVAQCANSLSQHIPVVCTIHQPSAEVFDMFNWMLLLKPGGTVAYFGPTQDLKERFADQRDPSQNLADFALDHICVGESVPLLEKTKQSLDNANKLNPDTPDLSVPRFAAPFWRQISVLLHRMFLSALRDTKTLSVSLGLRVMMGSVIGTLYWQLGDSIQDAQTRTSALFISTVLIANLQIVKIADLVAGRAGYYRELSSGMFHKLAYWISEQVVDIPFNMVGSTLFFVPFYYFSGMQTDRSFYAWLGFWVISETSAGLVRFLTALCPSRSVATVAVSGINSIFLIFAGFLITKDALPDGWIWMYYASFFRYCLFFLCRNELDTLELHCDPSTPASVCTTDSILDAFNINEWQQWDYFYALLGITAFFRIGHLLAVVFVNQIKR